MRRFSQSAPSGASVSACRLARETLQRLVCQARIVYLDIVETFRLRQDLPAAPGHRSIRKRWALEKTLEKAKAQTRTKGISRSSRSWGGLGKISGGAKAAQTAYLAGSRSVSLSRSEVTAYVRESEATIHLHDLSFVPT